MPESSYGNDVATLASIDWLTHAHQFEERVLERDVLRSTENLGVSGSLPDLCSVDPRNVTSPEFFVAEEDDSPDHASALYIGDGWPKCRWPWHRNIVYRSLTDDDFSGCITRGIESALTDRKYRSSSSIKHMREAARETLRHIRYDLNAVIEDKFDRQGTLPSFHFAAYSPRRFKRLRKILGISEAAFIESVCGAGLCTGSTSGGKSLAQFWFSHDRHFILKSLTQEEARTLNTLLPHYINHFEKETSLLGKFYGMYKITLVTSVTLRFVVMANVFYGHPIDRMFDLKGTTEDRLVNHVGDPRKVMMKDLNFTESFCLGSETADMLVDTIRSDVDFLNLHGLMDYSLIVGIRELPGDAEDPQPLDTNPFNSFHGGIQGWAWEDGSIQAKSLVYYLGIIDFLQEWTGWKTAAHCMKKITIGCCHEIDTEPPRVYRDRFLRYVTSKTIKVPTFQKVFLENALMRSRISELEYENRRLRRAQGEENDIGEIVVG